MENARGGGGGEAPADAGRGAAAPHGALAPLRGRPLAARRQRQDGAARWAAAQSASAGAAGAALEMRIGRRARRAAPPPAATRPEAAPAIDDREAAIWPTAGGQAAPRPRA
jgi:hypothetical protein